MWTVNSPGRRDPRGSTEADGRGERTKLRPAPTAGSRTGRLPAGPRRRQLPSEAGHRGQHSRCFLKAGPAPREAREEPGFTVSSLGVVFPVLVSFANT